MRDHSIDILRSIGLLMIILAHAGPPGLVFQLRNFDVPLVVLISGMAFGLRYKSNSQERYRTYIWKRIKRLVFPVWIFLTVYFLCQRIFITMPNLSSVLNSYLFMGGVGYFWIIKVFILVALVSPILYRYHKRTDSNRHYFIVWVFFLLSYELLRYLTLPYIGDGIGENISQLTHYIIPYSAIFAIGLRLPSLQTKAILIMIVVSFGTFCSIAVVLWSGSGGFVPTQAFKYPPSIYYFSYALFVTSILWAYRGWLEDFITMAKIKKPILSIGQNSIWMYLWHIPLVGLVSGNFIIKYLIVVFTSFALTMMQVRVVSSLSSRKSLSIRTQKNMKILFTG